MPYPGTLHCFTKRTEEEKADDERKLREYDPDGSITGWKPKEKRHLTGLSIGRVVHYTLTHKHPQSGCNMSHPSEGACRAALITDITDPDTGSVWLEVFQPPHEPAAFRHIAPYDENKGPGTWHWPEKV